MELEAYKIDLPYQNLLELRIVKLGDSKQSGYFLCTYQITDERSLLLKVLFTPKEPLANRDEVREFLKRAIEEERKEQWETGMLYQGSYLATGEEAKLIQRLIEKAEQGSEISGTT